MKRALLLAWMVSGLLSQLHAQDLIITTAGDSIQCRITEEAQDFTHFTLKYGDEYRRTLIANQDIKLIQKGFFGSDLIPEAMATRKTSSSLMLNVAGGWGRRTAKVSSDLPSDLREYLDELKNGSALEGSAHFYFSETIGYGVAASYFSSQNEIASIDVSDDISILFIGPSVQTRLSGATDNFHILTSTSLGYLSYHDDSRVMGEPMDIDGSTLGLRFDLKLAFPMGKQSGLLVGLSYQQGMLTKLTLSSGGQIETIDLDKEDYEGLNRLDLNLGFYLSQ